MTNEQIRRAHVLRKYQEGLMSRKEAAAALGLTERQITRLAKGLWEEGEAALIHKNTGRIVISYDPLYRLLKESGIESPRKHRRTKAHRL